MVRKRKTPDPHAEREAARYDNPIPSREYILDLLRSGERPLTIDQIAASLSIFDLEGSEALRRRLAAMERDGQLMSNRRGAYGLIERLDLVRGRVQAHRDGYGFLIPDDGGDDLYLSARQMSTVFDGDEVLCRVSGTNRRGQREGKVVEILQRHTTTVVGRFVEESGICFVIPDNARVNHDVLISSGDRLGAQSGQMVTVEITRYPARHLQPQGKVIEVLGEHLDPGMEIDVAIRSHGIPHVFPEEVLAEAAALEAEPEEADKRGRVDLRDLPFVTIDGEDARDFDDAVYCRATRSGWTLWVAIADVSHYVSPGSALDVEAELRGTSVYFPERVVPMLPEALSNGLCSLMPGVDRLSMVCEMHIAADGVLGEFRFYEAVIHSHARLTYTQVGAYLGGNQESGVPPKLHQAIGELHSLFKCLLQARENRGAVDFDTVETRIVFDEHRKIERIVPVVRNDAHRLIEECMLCANVATAQFLEALSEPALYRVHEGPSAERVSGLREFLGPLGLALGGGDQPGPPDYCELQESLGDREDAHLIQVMMLRSFKQAVYQPDNKGHFGLNYPAYAHFTSPIRRYPDLLVHRAIRAEIRSRRKNSRVQRVRGAGQLPKSSIYPYNLPNMVRLGEHCSMTERRADEATRDVDAWLKCEYLQEHVGDVFSGVISATTGFGVFVELEGLYIEGLVHISALPGDYYHFDQARQSLVGERSGKAFRLGDPVTVQVARVDLDEKKIDFELVESSPSKRLREDVSKRGPGKQGKNERKKAASKYQGKHSGKKAGGKKTSGEKSARKKSGASKQGPKKGKSAKNARASHPSRRTRHR